MGNTRHKIYSFYLISICFIFTELAAEEWESIGPFGLNTGGKLIMDPHDSNNLFLYGGRKGILYRSDDGAGTWVDISLPYSGSGNVDIVISEKNPNELYAISYQPSNVFKSTSDGDTWELYFSDSEYDIFYINPHNPKHLLAYKRIVGTYSHTIERSVDTGENWEDITGGIDLSLGTIIKTWVHPKFSNRIYAFQPITNGGDVVYDVAYYKTTNEGETWERFTLDSSQSFIDNIIFDPLDSLTLYVKAYNGWFKTDDNCSTFIEIGRDLPGDPYDHYPLTIDETNTSILYFAVDDPYFLNIYIYKSIDGGLSWSVFCEAPQGWKIISFLPMPSSLSDFYTVSYPYGVFFTDNWGINWRNKSRGLVMTRAYSVEAVDENTIIASVGSMGIFRTSNGGESWDTIWDNMSSFPSPFLVSRSDPNIIYIMSGGHYYVSNDMGDNWDFKQMDPSMFGATDIAQDNKTFYSGVRLGSVDGLTLSGIMKSLNGGETWEVLDLGLEGHVNYIDKIKIDWGDDLIVYAVVAIRGDISENILIRTIDGGKIWTVLQEKTGTFFLNKLVPNKLYYFRGDTLSVSSDRGDTWNYQSVLPNAISVIDLEIDPHGEEVLYVSTGNNGILKSHDDGRSWISLFNDQHRRGIRKLSVVTGGLDSTVLFGATNYQGVQTASIARDYTAINDEHLYPKKYNLIGNYPNPFNPITTIRYELPQFSHVRLSVYDILGREVAVLGNREEGLGVREVQWDASTVPSGVYFVQMRAGGFQQVRKVMVLK